jgi:hypothetical protein
LRRCAPSGAQARTLDRAASPQGAANAGFREVCWKARGSVALALPLAHGQHPSEVAELAMAAEVSACSKKAPAQA